MRGDDIDEGLGGVEEAQEGRAEIGATTIGGLCGRDAQCVGGQIDRVGEPDQAQSEGGQQVHGPGQTAKVAAGGFTRMQVNTGSKEQHQRLSKVGPTDSIGYPAKLGGAVVKEEDAAARQGQREQELVGLVLASGVGDGQHGRCANHQGDKEEKEGE